MSRKIVIGFDLYGTLLSTESIAEQLGELFGHDVAKELATQWRRYQLEYTWRSNSMGTYQSFSQITRAALQHAVAEKSLTLSQAQTEGLMDAYNGLKTFPEIESAMKLVDSEPSLNAYVFSNGTDEMVTTSVRTSPVLSKINCFSKPGKLITVDSLKTFKPDPKTYYHLADEAGVKLDQVWVVSANPFDALGARSAGAQSAWIDRAGNGWIDALGSSINVEPTIVVRRVDEAVAEILRRSRNEG
ncbi:haloacid dehalogenase [Dactylonectria estremocensis]|uniref:Haloacid dehalogenase n=1 Tax=Dactylonectria estremocensis TaxID=1079267 RepID=A0A9P9J0X5_9HYPO|nr:haloacid dehalogenase [Dactylonectria estremocensis]